MKKQTVLGVLLLFVMFCFNAKAEVITVEGASEIANAFFTQSARSQKTQLKSATQLEYAWDSNSLTQSGSSMLKSVEEDPTFYVFNNPDGEGFVIVSGDSNARSVIGYSYEGNIPAAGEIPDPMKDYLLGIDEEIKWARTNLTSGNSNLKATLAETGGTQKVLLNTATGDNFYGWMVGNDVVSTENPYTFTATATQTYTAKFLSDGNTVEIYHDYLQIDDEDIKANCSVTGLEESGALYPLGVNLTITANCERGYKFNGWYTVDWNTSKNILLSTENPYSFETSVELAVIFYSFTKLSPAQFTVTTADADMGTATWSFQEAQGDVYPGEEITLTATPKSGYMFAGWSDGTSTISNSKTCTVAVEEGKTYTANFAKQTFTVSATPDGENGTVTVYPNGTVEYGTEVTFTATANPGYRFTKWSDESTENPRTITSVTDHINLIAYFEAVPQGNTPLLTFACLSDLHAQQDFITDANNIQLRESVTKTLNQIKSDENVDLIVLGGDYTSNNPIPQTSWETTRELLVNATRGAFNADKTPVIYVNGNHDYEVANYDNPPRDYNAGEYYGTPMKTDIGALAAEDCFYEAADNGTGTAFSLLAAYHYVVNGFDFVVLNAGKNLFTSASDYTYSLESVQWCESKLAEIYATDKNKTVFFLVHIPFSDSKSLSSGKGMTSNTATTLLKTTLAKYPNLVMLYGHDHGNDTAYIRTATEQRVTEYATNGDVLTQGESESLYYIQNYNTSKYLGFNSKNLATTATQTSDVNLIPSVVSGCNGAFLFDFTNYPSDRRYLHCGASDNNYSGNASNAAVNQQIYLYKVADPTAETITATLSTTIEAGKTYMLVARNSATGTSYYALSDEMYQEGTDSQRMLGVEVTITNNTITYNRADYNSSLLWTINKKPSATDKSFFSSFMGSMRYYNNTIEGTDQLAERNIVQALMVYVYSDRVELKMKNYAQSGTINGITVNEDLTPYVSYRTVTHSAEQVTATPTITPQGGVVNPGSITVTVDAPEWHNLYYTINGEDPTEDSNKVVDGRQITFTATEGEYVVKVVAQEGIRLISASDSVTYTVMNTHGITVSTNGEGGTASFTIEGTNVILTASEAAEGYEFVGWSVGESADIVSTDNPYTTTIEENTAYKANYAKRTYTVTVSTNNAEWGTVNTIANPVTHGETVTLTAEPKDGCRFVNWTKGQDVVSTDATFTTEAITANVEYIANFEEIPLSFEVSATASPAEGGNVELFVGTSAPATSLTVEENTQVTFSATANDGYRFIRWSKGGQLVSEEPSYTTAITSTTALVAEFELKTTYRVVVTGGTANGSANSEIEKGTEVTFTATVPDGQEFVNWTSGEDIVSTDETFTIKLVGDINITANFRDVQGGGEEEFEYNYCPGADANGRDNNSNYGLASLKISVNDNEQFTITCGNKGAGTNIQSFLEDESKYINISPNDKLTVTVTGRSNTRWGKSTVYVDWQGTGTFDDVTGTDIFAYTSENGASSAPTNVSLNLTVPAQCAKVFALRVVTGEDPSHGGGEEHSACSMDRGNIQTFRCVLTSNPNPSPSYFTNFGTTNRGGRDRNLTSFAFDDGYNTSKTITVNQPSSNGAQIFFDKTSEVVILERNVNISSSISWTGSWMHSYFYIDFDNDGAFERSLGTNNIPNADSELLAFSFWSGTDGGQPNDTSGYDHTGTYISENSRDVWSLKTFKIPAGVDAGIYRARFKIDWNCANPDSNTSNGDAPCVVDFMVKIIDPISVSGTAGEEVTIKVKTDVAGAVTANGVTVNTQAGVETSVTTTIPQGGNLELKSKDATIVGIGYADNIIPAEKIPSSVKEIELRNTSAGEVTVNAPALEKITVVSDASNNVAKVSTASDLSQGVQVVVEKEIITPHAIDGKGTPTYFNFLSMPFAFNTANIKYWDGDSWETPEPENHVRILLYNSQKRANNDYKNTWEKITTSTHKTVAANQGFVIVGNNYLGTTVKLRFTSATEAYNGSVNTVTAKAYRNESGATSSYDTDWNFNGVPFLTNGLIEDGYTLYFHNGYGYEASVPAEGNEIAPYQSVMYQADVTNNISKMITVTPASSVSRATNAAEDVFARAYIAVDNAAPAKIILSDESSENFVVNEDAWYMAPTANAEPAAYFNIGGSDAAVTVQPAASELPMTVYTGAGTSHRISLTATDGNYNVYLKDAATDETVCLNDEDYTFTATAKTTIADRFTVSMIEPTGIIDAARAEGTIKPVVLSNAIKLYGTEEGDQVSLYTANGMIITNAVTEEGVTTIPTSVTGVIIIKVAGETVKVVK